MGAGQAMDQHVVAGLKGALDEGQRGLEVGEDSWEGWGGVQFGATTGQGGINGANNPANVRRA